MPIILATTYVTIKGNRPQSPVDPGAEGYDPPADPAVILASRVRACITQLNETRNVDGLNEAVDYRLMIDPVAVGLTPYDTVVDETTGKEYEVRSASKSLPTLFGLTHIRATIRESKGLSDVAIA